jgi:hypothetical protein
MELCSAIVGGRRRGGALWAVPQTAQRGEAGGEPVVSVEADDYPIDQGGIDGAEIEAAG